MTRTDFFFNSFEVFAFNNLKDLLHFWRIIQNNIDSFYKSQLYILIQLFISQLTADFDRNRNANCSIGKREFNWKKRKCKNLCHPSLKLYFVIRKSDKWWKFNALSYAFHRIEKNESIWELKMSLLRKNPKKVRTIVLLIT